MNIKLLIGPEAVTPSIGLKTYGKGRLNWGRYSEYTSFFLQLMSLDLENEKRFPQWILHHPIGCN